MTWLRLVRAELRKLYTTRMPWAFMVMLVVISSLTAVAVAFGTDMDGSKAFIAAAADQQSLVAFAFNALMGSALFGAIAVAREYGHGTVVPMYLTEPRRHRAVLAQAAGVLIGGAVLSFVGAGITIIAVAISLQTTDYGFLVSAGGVAQVIAASVLAGSVGAVLGGGIGALVRNTGGAVGAVVGVLFIAPPLIVQLASETGSWMPNILANVASGVADDIGIGVALAALIAWAIVPASLGLLAVKRRDVV